MQKSGIVLINKPINISSHKVLMLIKRKYNFAKIGHAGTLDPLATGLLIVLINEATKISDYLLNDNKQYIVTMTFNVLTNTGDITGDIIKKENKSLGENEFKKILVSFIKKYWQEPPIYSAIKVEGKKLYEYARENRDVKIKKRLVEIKDLELINFDFPNATIRVDCSKGTYIRSLIVDMAQKINMIATVSKLERTKSGKFELKAATNVENISDNNLISIYQALKDKFKVVNYQYPIDIFQGKPIVINDCFAPWILVINDVKEALAIYYRKDINDNKYYCKRGLWLKNGNIENWAKK